MTVSSSPLLYIKKVLNFALSEWQELSPKDKDTLKEWAEKDMKANLDKEMEALGEKEK